MTVKTILSHKGNDVVTIKPTATLCDAAKILDEHGIGAVVITGADKQISAFYQSEILCVDLLTARETQAAINFLMNRSKR